MEEQNAKPHGWNQSITSMMRDSVAIVFRRRRLIRKAFLWTLLGALLAVMIWGIQYESDSEIFVRPWARTPAAITADNSPRPLLPGDNDGVEEAINSEIELLTADDILQHVVVTCGLQYGPAKWYRPYKLAVYRAIPGYWDNLIPKATARLNDDLEIDEVKSSNALTIAYDSNNRDIAACVNRALISFYMAKHVAAWRPAQMFSFFADQTEDYKKRLYADEQQLLDYASRNDAVDAAAQMNSAVNTASNFLANLRDTQENIAETQAQIRADQSQLASMPPRVPTSEVTADNPQLLADLKSDLTNLLLKRTTLLVKYAPDYPLVKEVETQIEQTKQAIAEQLNLPTHDNTTDQNQVYLQVQEDLAKNVSLLPNFQAKVDTAQQMIDKYKAEALAYDAKSVVEADISREVSAMQGDYLLYLSKREEARIDDMLNLMKVDNVSVIKPPTVPYYPLFNPIVLVLLAILLALIIAVFIAFAVDYVDPSFRTPDEVQEFLHVPVFASIPENGQEAVVGTPVGAVPRNGH